MKYSVYYGDSKCVVYNTDVLYSLNMKKTSSEHGDESDDVYANNYIDNLGYMNLSLSGDTLTVSFSPCENTELLDRVRDGKTKVRIQILMHIISAIHSKRNNDDNPRGRKYFKYLELPYGYYWNNYASTQHGQTREEFMPTEPEKFIRYRSHDPNFYGTTWLDLTADQLSNGEAVLTNLYRLNAGWMYVYDSAIRHSIEYYSSTTYQRFSVEMYCPAIYRSGKDPFYYERHDGIRYIADDYVEISHSDFPQ